VTTWDDYVAALGELDAVRRNAAAAVASQERAAQSAQAEMIGVRQRITLQRARIADVATRARRPVPELTPQMADRASAAMLVPRSVMDPMPGVSAALTGAVTTLDTADAALSIAADAPAGGGLLASWQPIARNTLVYGWYALLALIALVIINAFAGSAPSARFTALGFDLAVPCGAILLSVISIGLLYPPDRFGRKPRSVAIGLLVCAIPLVIGAALSVL
jgi:hypothetical protein